ncbi:MAG: hypothetical protein ACYTFP_08030 [Planctomycetota bacterium]
MPEGFTEPSLETTVRPVFLVDKSVFQSYSAYIRTILVGLSGTAGASALVCPSGTDPQAILCPSVEHVEHPALRLPIFWSQNRPQQAVPNPLCRHMPQEYARPVLFPKVVASCG